MSKYLTPTQEDSVYQDLYSAYKNDDELLSSPSTDAHFQESENKIKPGISQLDDFSWNNMFQSCLEKPESTTEESREKWEEMTRISIDYVEEVKRVGRTIIAEHLLPSSRQTIHPLSIGGVAGGAKYRVRGIFFKLSKDPKIGKNHLYSATNSPNYELASKSGGHELKAGSSYLATSLALTELKCIKVPMFVTLDWLGFRLLAMPWLPLKKQVYGSADACKTFHNQDKHFVECMKLSGEWLHLEPHMSPIQNKDILLYSAGDVEGHLGTDGRRYLLDLARTFPPEHPVIAHKISGLVQRGASPFYRFFRPEYLALRKRYAKCPLSPDALTNFGLRDAEKHNNNVKVATEFLLNTLVPDTAKELINNNNLILAEPISEIIHRRGINIRHIGLLRSILLKNHPKISIDISKEQKDNVSRSADTLLVEIVSRTFKNIIRKLLRQHTWKNSSTTEYDTRLVILEILNKITGAHTENGFWQNICLEISYRFGEFALTPLEKNTLGTVLRKTSNSINTNTILTNKKKTIMTRVVEYLLLLSRVVLTEMAHREFLNCPIGFEFTSADISEYAVVLKHMSILDFAHGKLLFLQGNSRIHKTKSMKMMINSATNSATRLCHVSAASFALALKSDTLNTACGISRVKARVAQFELVGNFEGSDSVFLEELDSLINSNQYTIWYSWFIVSAVISHQMSLWSNRRKNGVFLSLGGSSSLSVLRNVLRIIAVNEKAQRKIEKKFSFDQPSINKNHQSILKEREASKKVSPILSSTGPPEWTSKLLPEFSEIKNTRLKCLQMTALTIRSISCHKNNNQPSVSDTEIKRCYKELDDQSLVIIEEGNYDNELIVDGISSMKLSHTQRLSISSPDLLSYYDALSILGGKNITPSKKFFENVLLKLNSLPILKSYNDARQVFSVLQECGIMKWMSLEDIFYFACLNDIKSLISPLLILSPSLIDNTSILFKTIGNNVSSMVQLLAENGANLESIDSHGKTPLIQASSAGFIDTVKVLIDFKANIHITSKREHTALLIAVNHRHSEVVNLLIKSNACVLERDRIGRTPFMIACRRNDHHTANNILNAYKLEIQKDDKKPKLIDYITMKNDMGMNALHFAAEKGCFDSLQLLIGLSPEILHSRDSTGQTALMKASTGGHKNCVDILLEKQADINAIDNSGRSSIFWAAENTHLSTLQFLLSKKANVNIQDNYGVTTLIVACSIENEDKVSIVKALLEAKADPLTTNNKKENALTKAAIFGYDNIVRLLLQEKVPVDQCDHKNRTPLFKASEGGHTSVVRILLNSNANPNHLNHKQRSPLHIASYEGVAPCVAELLHIGANVDTIDENGETALLSSCIKGHLSVASLLISAQSDISLRSKDGITCLHLASVSGKKDLIDLLISKKAEISACDSEGMTPIMKAARAGKIEAVKSLLKAKAEVNRRDRFGETALRKAAKKGHTKVVNTLKQKYSEYNDDEDSAESDEFEFNITEVPA